MWIVYFVIALVFSVVNNQQNFEKDQVLDLIASSGYKGEAHYVETVDGYILKLHRIVPRYYNKKKPVLLVHGILASSADFLITGKENAIAYLLSDAGYDVWLGEFFQKYSFLSKKKMFEHLHYWLYILFYLELYIKMILYVGIFSRKF
jgi:Partial alpha/beta-hydrolase lipase region